MLLFFSISGIWQTLGLRWPILERLSTIHTEWRQKDGSELSSPALKYFVILMALSFIITTILGVTMALNFGRSRKPAIFCLSLGVIIPSVIVLLRIFR